MSEVNLYLGDCLEILPTLIAKVDAIITDLPYGTTACNWDVVIPFAPMWEQVKRLLKPNGAFVTTASQPFTSLLVCSNLAWFRYEWVWDKRQTTGVGNVKVAPLKAHETIEVFCKETPTYHPQLNPKGTVKAYGNHARGISETVRPGFDMALSRRNVGYPKSILTFPRPNNINGNGGLHPTQKSLELYEYLIHTYTNLGDTVLDFCMGSGTTGVACVKLGRNFIGCEIRPDYYAIAERRIHDAQLQIPMPLVCQ